MKEELCPVKEIQRMESELWNLRVKDYNINAYTQSFNELILLCPEMVPTEKKKIEAYIRGLSENVKGETTSSKPATLNEAVRMAHTLMEHKLQAKNERVAEENKRKWENSQSSNRNNHNNSWGNYRDNSCHHQYNNQRQGNAREMTTAQNEGVDQGGPASNCSHYGVCHFGRCLPKCNKCGKIRHKSRDCRGKAVATGAYNQPIKACYECGDRGHTLNRCPKRNNQRGRNALGRAYVIREAEQNPRPNVVTGTFFLNNFYATILFDSGSDKSFVNTSFSHLIDIKPVKLNTSYEVELVDGKIVSTNTVLRVTAAKKKLTRRTLYSHGRDGSRTAQTTTTAKLPILKQGEYDMWRLRIEQYFQVQDYALWDVIENGNSFKPVAQTTTNADGTSTSLIPGPVTKKTKVKRIMRVKAKASEDCKSAGYPRNKPNLDTMSFEDLYNNFKIVEHEVKGTTSSSSRPSS
ncbi:putative reverse transcriptase domain-containing protein [Tanacetum coccineum]|uniref:Reverse transcriptase domain-containing protein n=1 Tax=Tanacetum coccineum TaxID=301880 RepID=A0ABQ5C9T5_9ASTR